VLNVEGYYDPLLGLFDRALADAFVSASNRRIVQEETDPDRLLGLLANYRSPHVQKWIGTDES
jgi:predicted Rossmann-fold nucleotide-binding protein